MASPFSGSAGRKAGIWAGEVATNIWNGQQGLLNEGQAAAAAALEAARTNARTEYGGAIDRLDPYNQAGLEALGVYRGSLGLGGDAARDSAVAAYRASPGYERRVNEATDAVARKASALGALGSGNTMQAISDRANYLADEDYGRWQGQVQGVADRGQQAATTQSGFQGQLGNTLAGLGQSEANSIGNFYGLKSGALQNFGDTFIGAGTGALMAGQQAAQNRLNFGMGLANLGASLAGRALGGKVA